MASLRDVVRRNKDELRDGIAWVAFWKEGRSWQAEYFWLDCSDDSLYSEDKSRLEEIQSIDPSAVVLNGYYCGYLSDEMNVNELAEGVRWHYENGANDIASFIDEHKRVEAEESQEEAGEQPGENQEVAGRLPGQVQEAAEKTQEETGVQARKIGALIVPLPESCSDCKYSYGYLLHYCNEKHSDVEEEKLIPIACMNGEGRPDWCPIRAVPDDLSLCSKHGQDLPEPELFYRLGWNTCRGTVVGVPKKLSKKEKEPSTAIAKVQNM